MKHLLLLIAFIGLLSCEGESKKKRIDYVNTLIGTDTWQSDVAVAGHEDPSGYTYPCVGEPFGKTGWTAHTIESKDAGKRHHRVPYWYSHNYITGFLGTHYPSGAVMYDYGAIELMPVVGNLKTAPEERASAYLHSNEKAHPEYYEVSLDDYNVKAQISARNNAAIHNYVFPESDSSYVIVDAMPSIFTAGSKASVNIDPDKREVYGRSALTARGYRETGYYVIKFDKDFEDFGTFNHNAQYPEVIETDYLFTQKDGEWVNGLTATYTQGDLVQTRIDPVVEFDWDWYRPADDFDFRHYQAEWVGKLKAPMSGKYVLGLYAVDGGRVYLDGKLLIDDMESGNSKKPTKRVEVYLEKDKMYDLKVEYYQNEWASKIKLSWIKPDDLAKKVIAEGNKQLQLSTKIGAYLNFKTKKGEVVKAKIGTSFISVEQARANLEKEIPEWSIETVRKQTADAWEKELAVVDLDKCSENDKTIFYTALYHSFLLPRSISEHGKYRSPFDGKVYEGESYTDYSIWDTYRATHPLFVLLNPERVNGMITGLLNAYDEGGWMPKWPNPGYTNTMYGTHGDAVIADAYVKGVKDFDLDKAKEAMFKNAYQKGDYMYWGRWGIEDYNRLGYVPGGGKYWESVARTMEFAYDDYCIAQFLNKKGDKEEAEEFYKRSQRFKNVLDDETKMVRARNADGTWRHPDDYSISHWSGYSPKGVYNYKKNYTLCAPQDVHSIINFLGGNEEMTAFLDELFDNDIYYVGDEFSMHAPFLYNFAATPWKTQKRVNDIVKNYYLDTPGGLPGNDDCGQLSSWYLFSAMGFYPVCPGETHYQIGTPCLPEVSLNLTNGNKFKIIANNLSDENIYIQSVKLNGIDHTVTALEHADILKGGKIVFEMGAKPNKEWFKN